MAAPDPALALQDAVIVALRGDAGLAALVGRRTWDTPPQGAGLPFVRLGQIEVRPYRSGCGKAWELRFGIECQTQAKQGRVEAGRINAAVEAVLDDADLPLVGFALEWLEFVTSTVIRGGNGETYKGSCAFVASLAKLP